MWAAEQQPAQPPAAPKSKYARAQLHGFEVFTLPGNANDGCTRTSQFDATDEKCYIGVDDVGEDARMRVELMIRAIDAAVSSAGTNHSSDVLHVFLAPEFFFRGPAGAYVIEDLVSSKVSVLHRAIALDPDS